MFLPKFSATLRVNHCNFGILDEKIGELDEDHVSNYLSVREKSELGLRIRGSPACCFSSISPKRKRQQFLVNWDVVRGDM